MRKKIYFDEYILIYNYINTKLMFFEYKRTNPLNANSFSSSQYQIYTNTTMYLSDDTIKLFTKHIWITGMSYSMIIFI